MNTVLFIEGQRVMKNLLMTSRLRGPIGVERSCLRNFTTHKACPVFKRALRIGFSFRKKNLFSM